MERVGAALGGLGFVVAIFGGIVIIRVLTRALYAAIWFAETLATFAFALLILIQRENPVLRPKAEGRA